MIEDYAWSTHQPLIRLLLKVYNPRLIVELGIGYYSTPLFQAHKCEKMFIENDRNWIKQMGIKENVVLHEIDIPNQDIPVHDISPAQRQSLIEDYHHLKESIRRTECSLLFVDNYSCCRALAINILYPVFDLIIYHDCEPQSIQRNNYYFDERLISDYDHYNLVTPRTWAGCFVSKKLPGKDLFEEIEPIIEDYQRLNNVTGIKLIINA